MGWTHARIPSSATKRFISRLYYGSAEEPEESETPASA
jgi:hypothetical protein